VAVVEHAARSAQRERPLVVVFRHLLVLGVLDDLEEPEADAKRGKHDHARHLQHGEPDTDTTAIFLYGHIVARRFLDGYRLDRLNLRRSIAPGSDSMMAN